MARVYAPARAESYTSDSSSTPKLTPTSSEDKSTLPTSYDPSQSTTQPIVSQTCPGFAMNDNPVTFPQSSRPPQAVGYGSNAHFNSAALQSNGMPSAYAPFLTPYSTLLYPAYPSMYRPVSSTYQGYAPYAPAGYSQILTNQTYGIGPQAPVLSAQLQFENQTEADAKRIMACKIVDELMKLDLSKDQVLATGAAVISSLKSSKASQQGDPAQAGKHKSTETTEQQIPNESTMPQSSTNGDSEWDNTTQGHERDAWSLSNNTIEWEHMPDDRNSNWINAPTQDIITDLNNHEPLLPSHPVEPSRLCNSDSSTHISPRRDTWTINDIAEDHFAIESQSSFNGTDYWRSADADSEEAAGEWYDTERDEPAFLLCKDTNIPSWISARKFEDPYTISAYIDCSTDQLQAPLYVPKATLTKLLYHADFKAYQLEVDENSELCLPSGIGCNREAVKEILHLLEMETWKQEAICSAGFTPHLQVDMYAIAVNFHLDTVAQALLDSMYHNNSLSDYIEMMQTIYQRNLANADLRENVKFEIARSFQFACGGDGSWTWDGADAAEKSIHEWKAIMSSIEDQDMKNDIYQIMLEKLCSDAQIKVQKELTEEGKIHPGEQGILLDAGDDYTLSYQGEMGDGHDLGAAAPWEGFQDQDEDEVMLRPPPTPDNNDWDCAPKPFSPPSSAGLPSPRASTPEIVGKDGDW